MPMPEAEHPGTGPGSPNAPANVCPRCQHRVTSAAPYCHYCGVQLWWGGPSIRDPGKAWFTYTGTGCGIGGCVRSIALALGWLVIGCFGLMAVMMMIAN